MHRLIIHFISIRVFVVVWYVVVVLEVVEDVVELILELVVDDMVVVDVEVVERVVVVPAKELDVLLVVIGVEESCPWAPICNKETATPNRSTVRTNIVEEDWPCLCRF